MATITATQTLPHKFAQVKRPLPRKFVSENGYNAFIDYNGNLREHRGIWLRIKDFNRFRKRILETVPINRYV